MQAGAAAATDRRSGQKSLFGGDEDDQPETGSTNLPEIPPWDGARAAGQGKRGVGLLFVESLRRPSTEKTLATYCSHTTVEAAELKHTASK